MNDVIYQYQQAYVPNNGNIFHFWVDCTKEIHDEEAREGGTVRTLYAAPPALVMTAELFAYSYLYAAYETCDGFAGWSHNFSLEHPPEWMLETGKVKNLRKLYTVPPAPELRVPDGWIKCSERYPEVGQEVLIRIPVCEKFNIENGKYEGDGQFLGAWFDTRGKGRPYKVTHWMPLPPPPEASNEQ